jgi:class 3 adenylate cyclase
MWPVSDWPTSSASIQRPTRSIQCAIVIRQRLRQSGLEVRSAVHTGECEVRGDDFTGIAIEVSSQLLDHARPSEIIASRTVRDLVVGSDLMFDERGDAELAELPGSLQLFSASGSRT